MKKQKVMRMLSVLLASVMLITSSGIPVLAQTEDLEDGPILIEEEQITEADALIESEEEAEDTDALIETGEEAEDADALIGTTDDEDVSPEKDGPQVTLKYKVFDGEAEITGYTHIGSASDSLGDLIIPGTIDGYTVTSIGESAFRGASSFTGNLTIPDSVFKIGDSAFDGCVGLKGSLVIPDSVVYIGPYAFRECNGMTGELTIGKNVEEIGDGAFYGCNGLQGDINIPARVTKIGNSAFQGCTGFEGGIIFGKGDLQSIGTSAFAGLNIEDGITFFGKVGNINDRAFYECKNINGPLVFMDSVGYIGKFAFAHCEYLRGSLTFTNTSLKDNSFKGCKRLGPVLTLGKNTEWDDSLGMYSHSFQYCCGIKKVVNKTNKKFSLNGLKSDSYKDAWGIWTDQKGNVVYELVNGTAIRDDLEEQYSITVPGTAQAYNTDEKVIYSAKKGEKVGIFYYGNKEFVRWESKNKGVKFANPNSSDTTFTMPAEDVVITYVEKEASPAPKTYTITMQAGSEAYDTDEKYIEEAGEGDIVNVVWLYEGEDKEFVKWESQNKGVKFKDPYDEDTTFVMPAENVVITYVEKEKGTPGPGPGPEPEPDPETKVCPNVVTKQKVDLSTADYFGASFDSKDKLTVEPMALGSVSKGIFSAKKPGEVTVTWTDKDKNVKGIAKFTVETPEIDYPINPKNGKKLTCMTYYRLNETIDVSALISTPSGLTPVKYECSDKKGKNFSFDEETKTLTVLNSGSCKITVFYNYGDNDKFAAKYPVSIKSSLPKLKGKINLKAGKSTNVTITNVQKDLEVSWGAFVMDENGEWIESDKLIVEEDAKSNNRKCKITANADVGDEICLTAFVGDEEDEYDCYVTIKK